MRLFIDLQSYLPKYEYPGTNSWFVDTDGLSYQFWELSNVDTGGAILMKKRPTAAHKSNS